MEDLDVVVAAVGHRDPPVGADGDGGRRKVPLKVEHMRAVGMEDLDAVIAGAVRHDDPTVGAKGDVWRPSDTPQAAEWNSECERPVGVEDLHPELVRVTVV